MLKSIDCIETLFLHEGLSVGNVKEALGDVKVKVFKVIKTHCVYKDEIIPGSEVKKDLFLQMSESKLIIYFRRGIDVHSK